MPFSIYFMGLVARLVVAGLGAALAFYGLANLVTTAQAWLATGGSLYRTGNAALPTAPIELFGLHIGFAALGIGMFLYAASDIVTRVRARLRTEDGSTGRSRPARLASLLVCGAGFCLGAISLAVGIVPGTQTALLVANGVTVDATVLGFEVAPGTQEPVIRYQFAAPGGRKVSDTMALAAMSDPSPGLLERLKVTYLRADPSQHQVTSNYSHTGFASFFGIHVLLVVISLWGMARALAPSDRRLQLPFSRAGRGEAYPSPPPDTPRIVPTFGRRHV